MKMTNGEYQQYVQKNAPRSPIWPNMLRAFLVGGLICCLGQGLGDAWGLYFPDQQDAAAAASMTLVFLGALFTGLGLYDNLGKFAGAGSLVPITGFANAVVSPALEFKSEGLITSTAAKMFIIAGPVIVYGIGASVLYGLILALFAL